MRSMRVIYKKLPSKKAQCIATVGVFDGIHGLVAGRFEACGDMDAISGLLLDAVANQDIPVMTGLPVGHGRESITLPLGLEVSIDTDQMALSFAESCVN